MGSVLKLLTASVVLALAAGCGGEAGAPGQTGETGPKGDKGDSVVSLTDLSAEAPGGNCAYGGHRIETGIDENGNGTLDAGEINPNATRYLCNDAPAGNVHHGSITARNTADLAELNTYDGVIGDVFVEIDPLPAREANVETVEVLLGFVTGELSIRTAKGTSSIVVPNLTSVGGAFFVYGSELKSFKAPELVTAGDIALEYMSDLTEFDLDALTMAGRVTIANTGVVEYSLPSLQWATGLAVNDNPALTSIDLSELEEVRGTSFYIGNNEVLTSVNLDELIRSSGLTVSGNRDLESLDLPELMVVKGSLSISNNTNLSGLGISKLVGWTNFGVQNNPELSECALKKFQAEAFKDIANGSLTGNKNDMSGCVVEPSCVRLTDADGDTPWMVCSDKQKFTDAQVACDDLGSGTLASFADVDEFTRFVDAFASELRLTKTPVWVGYQWSNADAAWAWEDGASTWVPSAGEFWNDGEPASSACAEFNDGESLLASVLTGNQERRYACSVPLTP